MPELPEVETIKEAMRKAVNGNKIESVTIYNRHLRCDIPANFEKFLCGTKVNHIYRIAKYALMELDNGYTVIWHFGMSGKVRIIKEKNLNLEKHDHVVIRTSENTIIYNDPRRFGMILLCNTNKLNENPLFCHLGLDPFDENLTESYLSEKLTHKRVPIKVALLDQSIISGIGNIYASEALYDARISPLRESCSLTKKELRKLIESIRFILDKAIAAGGSTLHDYHRPDGSIGYFQFQHCVYGKDGQKCPHCICKKDRIIKIVQTGRSTYYCEHLQK